jgi:AcrR family transcriptional regulator
MPFPAKTDPESILAAALEMLEQDGPEKLSMRNLAKKLEMKAPSLYRHYKDKAALEDALIQAGSNQLQSLLTSQTSKQSPEDALRSCARTYLEFTRNHPHVYNLMHTPNMYSSTGKRQELWKTVLRIVGAVTQNPDDTDSTVAFWAFVHGFCSLERTGQFGSSGPKGGFEAGLEALITGFSSHKAKEHANAVR